MTSLPSILPRIQSNLLKTVNEVLLSSRFRQVDIVPFKVLVTINQLKNSENGVAVLCGNEALFFGHSTVIAIDNQGHRMTIYPSKQVDMYGFIRGLLVAFKGE